MLIYILLLAIADTMVLVASDSGRGTRSFPRAIASVWVDVGLPGAGQSTTAMDPATVLVFEKPPESTKTTDQEMTTTVGQSPFGRTPQDPCPTYVTEPLIVASTGHPSGAAVPVVSSVTASGILSGVFYTGLPLGTNGATATPVPASNATGASYSGSLTPTSRVPYGGDDGRDPGMSASKASPGKDHRTCLRLLPLWLLVVPLMR